MPIDFTFRTIDGKNLDEATRFISSQNLGYPNYDSWVEKMRSELSLGIKHGIAAYSDGAFVGDVIFQEHKQIRGILEMKNIRIHPLLRGRNFAPFMLKQAEIEMNSEAVIVDARLNQRDMINFLTSQGYIPTAKVSLYDSYNEDVVMVKFKTQNQGRIISLVLSNYN